LRGGLTPDVFRILGEELRVAQFESSGTGSGPTPFFLRQLRDEYPGTTVSTHSILPSPKVSDNDPEAYNGCSETVAKPTYSDLNHLAALLMSGTTCPRRFPSGADLRNLVVDLVPFPRVHFFVCGMAPLSSLGAELALPELTAQLFDRKNIMAACDPMNGVSLALSAQFRGGMSPTEVEEQMIAIRERESPCFVPWIPPNAKASVCGIPPPGQKTEATFIANTTAFSELLTRIDGDFGRIYEGRAFVQWYTDEGLEIGEFDEVRSRLRNLIQE
jgi:tubulin beta